MNITLITPYYHPPVRGNAVTARRIERQLRAAGHGVTVHALDAAPAEEILRRIAADPPDLIHALHAYLGGRVAREAGRATGIPYLVTLTGSDVYEALEDARRRDTLAVLRDAAAVAAFHKCVRCRVLDHHPSLAETMAVIPQGVELPGEEFEWGEERFEGGEFVFFLPAGLRPVKNAAFALGPLAELHREDPRVRFLLAGPILDREYGAATLEAMDRHPFARYLGEVGRGAIGALFHRADVVINSSIFEGGMANSVLEALAFGTPVLASYIDGNRSVVKEGATGFLFRGEREFLDRARDLLRNPALGRRLGEQGRELVRERFSPERETEAYLELYRRITGA
ncbi:GPMC system family 4 glycosyltransferase [Geobacter anodireducens]|uniref:Glycoside hydrolase n=1 Tax=Geobacter soli TaxID=1510391 RepID=A0A0C1QTU9_9BACT|nr:GPMC system family 4 glycosyltransferase [Geobacter soli]ANA39842.1 glycoside hydrolase [Geobacter anodireducens]KIE41661.1 glycoside hydrolase [Geobacter soli]